MWAERSRPPEDFTTRVLMQDPAEEIVMRMYSHDIDEDETSM